MNMRHLNLDRIEFIDRIINFVFKFGDFKVQISSLHSTDFAGIKLKVQPIPARYPALIGVSRVKEVTLIFFYQKFSEFQGINKGGHGRELIKKKKRIDSPHPPP